MLEPGTELSHPLDLVVAVGEDVVIEHLDLQLVAGPAFHTHLLAFCREFGHDLVPVEDAIRFAAAELSLFRSVLRIFFSLNLIRFLDIFWL